MGNLFNKISSKNSSKTSGITSSTTSEKTSEKTSENVTDFETAILDAHNKIRNSNGLPSLVWDKSMAQKSLDWGKFMVDVENKGKCTHLRHPGTDGGTKEELEKYLPNNWGQNLYQSSGIRIEADGSVVPTDPSTPSGAVESWYSERSKYKKPKAGQSLPDDFMAVGHYTQLMWKDASKLGCSRVSCSDTITDSGTKYKSKGSMIICDYDKGNIGGQFADQVME